MPSRAAVIAPSAVAAGREVAAHPVEGDAGHGASSASVFSASCASTAISRASPSRGGAPS